MRPLLWLASLFLILGRALAEEADDPLAEWRTGVTITPVSPEASGHTIHSYFNTCPESPDGKRVLFFASSERTGEAGELRVRDRVTGEETVLASGLRVEDAHRVACQQWLSGGTRVSFHSEKDGEWVVSVVEVGTGKVREMARDRLTGWGSGDVVPLYGPHWKAGPHRDLELLNVATGEIQTALRADEVRPAWLEKALAGRKASIFFPVLNRDATRVFFKMAIPGELGDPRSSKASQRLGLVCYDLAGRRPLFDMANWGHPAWHPDGETIVETHFRLFESNTGKVRTTPGLPNVGGDHPSASPDGRLLITDSTMDRLGGSAKEWAIVLADARGGRHHLLHRFNNAGGATSWRRSHPHPVFSADGRRIYFNVSDGPWTRLFVAERSGQ